MLPDLLCDDLSVVICGTAAGTTSAQLQQYYAKPGNKFWATLYQVGLIPVQLNPTEYLRLLEYGIGLTDLVKAKAGMDHILEKEDFGNQQMVLKIKQYQPYCFCFNGKRAAEAFFERPVAYGRQEMVIGRTHFFVAPSTSGAANKWWNIDLWKELATFSKALA
ncbi:MAG: mismatch-specific DNA-glycosylase [Veillonellaceae bacterium]|nr:mismatch-specific DNA-glycosylase [Veillonellaceae bacterium]